MRTRTAMTVAGSMASLLLLGGVAYAAVQSVNDRPGPQVVVPSTSDDRHHARHGADDPTTHDANDDSNTGVDNTAAVSDDDPATHDVNDDSRGRTGGGHGGGGHSADDDPATHDVNDDSTSSSGGSGSDDSGSGHGGHGGDD